MRTAIVAGLLLALVVAGAPALAAGADDAKEARVNNYLRQGLGSLAAARKAKADSRKLALLDQAMDSLHRARGLRRIQGKSEKYAALDRSVARGLIQVLNARTRIYLRRGSLPQARKTNKAALAYSVSDTEALKLRIAIDEAWARDLYDAFEGVVGSERLGDNRGEAGEPARERGAARRR